MQPVCRCFYTILEIPSKFVSGDEKSVQKSFKISDFLWATRNLLENHLANDVSGKRRSNWLLTNRSEFLRAGAMCVQKCFEKKLNIGFFGFRDKIEIRFYEFLLLESCVILETLRHSANYIYFLFIMLFGWNRGKIFPKNIVPEKTTDDERVKFLYWKEYIDDE